MPLNNDKTSQFPYPPHQIGTKIWTVVPGTYQLSGSVWADGSLAELAGQLGKMMDHPNQSQSNPGQATTRRTCRKVSTHISIFEYLVYLKSIG